MAPLRYRSALAVGGDSGNALQGAGLFAVSAGTVSPRSPTQSPACLAAVTEWAIGENNTAKGPRWCQQIFIGFIFFLAYFRRCRRMIFCQSACFVSVAVLTASLGLLLSGQPACFWAISRLASTTRACSQPTNARGMRTRCWLTATIARSSASKPNNKTKEGLKSRSSACLRLRRSS